MHDSRPLNVRLTRPQHSSILKKLVGENRSLMKPIRDRELVGTYERTHHPVGVRIAKNVSQGEIWSNRILLIVACYVHRAGGVWAVATSRSLNTAAHTRSPSEHGSPNSRTAPVLIPTHHAEIQLASRSLRHIILW